ncbi:5-formyltetrahydrofolate cyclo-ligase [Sphingobacterium corticibacter]|nr:5-formyltetrahydrofolate cyclo-ligase [Sphingobacterium corticibacter]
MENMTKDELRASFKNKRLALLPAERQALDDQLLEGLKSLDLSAVRYVHIYLPIAKWKEYDTMPFIHWLRQYHPEIHIVVSVSELKHGTLEHFIWNTESVVKNAWGIPELVLHPNTNRVNPTDIDLVVIPLLVCDHEGNRIGYGKGYYDRFLQACRSDVHKVGISYFEPLDELIPADPWDVPLDRLITPAGSIVF